MRARRCLREFGAVAIGLPATYPPGLFITRHKNKGVCKTLVTTNGLHNSAKNAAK